MKVEKNNNVNAYMKLKKKVVSLECGTNYYIYKGKKVIYFYKLWKIELTKA